MANEYKLPYTGKEIENKLKQIDNLSNYITPQMFGAKGDGVTDDTVAINNAIKSLSEGGTLYFPSGVYIVNHGGVNYTAAISIKEKNNITIKLDNSAKIKHSVTDSGYYMIMKIDNCKNIEIYGGVFEGEADEHTNRNTSGTGGTLTNISSYTIKVIQSSNILIHNLISTNCYGDGIGIVGGTKQSENVVIENCIIHHHIRNGIHIGGGKNITINHCNIFDISGCYPMAGIDLETSSSIPNESIFINHCKFSQCEKYDIIQSAATKDMTLNTCKLNGSITVSIGETENTQTIIRNTELKSLSARNNCKIYNSILRTMAGYGPLCNIQVYDTIFTGAISSDNPTITFQNTTASAYFQGCEFTHNESNNHYLFFSYEATIEKLHLNECTFHLYNSGQDAFLYANQMAQHLLITKSNIIVESPIMDIRVLRLQPKNLTFTDNIVDLRKMITYNQSSIIALGADIDECLCANNIFLSSNAETPISNTVFGLSYTTTHINIINNIASNWDKIASASTSGGTAFIHNNIIATSTAIDNPSIETWTFTLDDGTTLEKKVMLL